MKTTTRLLAATLLGLTLTQAYAAGSPFVTDEFHRATRGDFSRVLEVKQNLSPDHTDAHRRAVENASVGPYAMLSVQKAKTPRGADYTDAYRRAPRIGDDAVPTQLVMRTGDTGDTTGWYRASY